MAFEKGLSKVIHDASFSLTVDSLYYATSANTRVNVRDTLENLLLRIEALGTAAAAEHTQRYLFNGSSEATFASGADYLLNSSYSWCLGIDIIEIDPTWAAVNMKMCILSSSGCHLTLNGAGPAPAQMGSYNTSKSDLWEVRTRAKHIHGCHLQLTVAFCTCSTMLR